MRTIIIGHQQPDLDSISAALIYTEFLKKQGEKNVVAGYCDIINDETRYILDKFKIDPPRLFKKADIKNDDRFILVDHNEKDQRLPGINDNQIFAIIDHHKASFNFNQPIKIDIRPWGSTSTIVYDYFLKNNLKPSLGATQILLSAILSDTIGLKSPTTTDIDQWVAKKLALATSLKISNFAFEIFKAKSKIDHLTPKEIALKDHKVFDFGGKKVFINQIETVEQRKTLEQKTKLIEAMKSIKLQKKSDYAYCLISDILKVNTKILFTNKKEQEIAERAFGGKAIEGVLDIGPRISRKKQIAPLIGKTIK